MAKPRPLAPVPAERDVLARLKWCVNEINRLKNKNGNGVLGGSSELMTLPHTATRTDMFLDETTTELAVADVEKGFAVASGIVVVWNQDATISYSYTGYELTPNPRLTGLTFLGGNTGTYDLGAYVTFVGMATDLTGTLADGSVTPEKLAGGPPDPALFYRGDGAWAAPGGGGGAADASDSVKGVTKLSVAPAVAADPIAAGDNDPRLTAAADLATHIAASDPHPGYALDTDLNLYLPKALVDAKGDLLVGTADDTVGRLPVGSNGQVLTADSAQTSGIKWATPTGGGGVTLGQWARIRGTSDYVAPSGGGYAPFAVEDNDTDGMVDLATHNERITIQTAGVYVATFNYRIDSSIQNSIFIRGGAAGTTSYASTKPDGTAAVSFWGTLTTPAKDCAVGEFFRIFANANIYLDGAGVDFYSYVFAVHRVA